MEEVLAKEYKCPQMIQQNLMVLGNYYFNLYYVKGKKKSALIEAGVSAVVDEVISQLEGLDAHPDYLIVTHPHSDHVTGIEGLQENYPDAAVITGKGAKAYLSHPKGHEPLIFEDAHISKMLDEKGYTPGRPPVKSPPVIHNGFEKSEGDIIDLGGVRLQFYDVEGHSPGNIMVYAPEISGLFVSDSLGFHFPKRRFIPLFFTGYQAYMKTLDRIESINPEILCPAHQGHIKGKDVNKAIKESRAAAKAFLLAVKEGRNDEQTIEKLFFDSYREEFRLYSEENILNCSKLLVRRCREAIEKFS